MTEPVWELLNDLEDLLQLGYRTHHEPAPRPQVRKQAEKKPAGVGVSGSADQADSGFGDQFSAIIREVRACKACVLHKERRHAVPGTGSREPLLMVVGSAPGADEDRTGLPFVGSGGQYLDKWLKAIGLSRHSNVFINYLVKCLPEGKNALDEGVVKQCLPYIERQISLLRPPMLLLLGPNAAAGLLGADNEFLELRGRPQSLQIAGHDIPVWVTYSPAQVLRDQQLRAEVWKDLQMMRDHLAQLRSDYRPPVR